MAKAGIVVVSILLLGCERKEGPDSLARTTTPEERKALRAAQPPPPPPPPPVKLEGIKAKKLSTVYNANEVAGDLKFKNHRLRVLGTVASIDKNFLDEPIVKLDGERFLHEVSCTFPKSAVPQLAELEKGNLVVLEGTVEGLILRSVMLKECVFPSVDDVKKNNPDLVRQ